MQLLKSSVINLLKLLLFWLLVFDLQRILFSIHNWDKFKDISWGDWFLAFVYSFRLDMATAALLSFLPLVMLTIYFVSPGKWPARFFKIILFIEIIIAACIHGGEINAYTEWNHKLTTRVFTHLLNPDEVVRTADYGMMVWFTIYAFIEIFIGYFLQRKLFPLKVEKQSLNWFIRIPVAVVFLGFFGSGFFLLARGGTQQIPINIDSAYYSKDYATNDLSVNSVYYFFKSFILYNRSEKGVGFPLIEEKKAKQQLADFFDYPKNHSNYILTTDRPNIVFIILESWTSNAVGALNNGIGATPYFDKLSEKGLLFTNIYASGSTSEVGNASIFSGYPALPEVFLSMQPDKHRKIPSLNQELKKWNYTSHYLFSGDLKYGNIGGFFMDHGFDVVEDENDFPSGLKHGKLNYYDEDLYKIFLKKINKTKEPFMHCAFTGSTHSPYDFPRKNSKKWNGSEAAFMESMYYADECLNDFLTEAKTKPWYNNTIFVLVADHGHAAPEIQNPSVSAFFKIPLLIYGEPLKKEYQGKKIDKIGSQSDIARTIAYQLKGDAEQFKWSKDLLNPQAPEFALHTVIRGYGWVSKQGNFTYNFDMSNNLDNTYTVENIIQEKLRCHSFMSLVYADFQKL
ncbi:MAG: LTA synthase family protein [Crocinitomicaceae bacterium]|jgi:phosphoglycerol transferase MdoB-like AlkP superfamily enzyme|nr:LTA synthase family protein [Crocinitomicaceae bacterium]MDP5009612.1 LTA synthase family protein [Crocinitomicaceae bacterium]